MLVLDNKNKNRILMKIKYINSHNLLKIATVILNEFLKKYQMKPSVI